MRGIARAIIKDTEGKSAKEVDKTMQEAVAYLASKGMLGRWRDLERELHEAWREKYGVSKVTIASAHPLTAQVKAKVDELAMGAEVHQVVDERLMGGALVRIDDRRIDGTVLGTLTRLKQALLS